jgi:hypothetical protein
LFWAVLGSKRSHRANSPAPNLPLPEDHPGGQNPIDKETKWYYIKGRTKKMKGTDTMSKSKQDILQQRIKGFLTYWTDRQRNTGIQIVIDLPKDQDWETLQDTVNISGRIFNIIYTKIGQAIWTKVLVQEQYSGRIWTEELEVQEDDPNQE